MVSLPYDPGVIPSKSAPSPGDTITIEAEGLPPYKDISRSIRNITHPRYDAFVALRKAATVAMNGRGLLHGRSVTRFGRVWTGAPQRSEYI